jgi:hypothetical protein
MNASKVDLKTTELVVRRKVKVLIIPVHPELQILTEKARCKQLCSLYFIETPNDEDSDHRTIKNNLRTVLLTLPCIRTLSVMEVSQSYMDWSLK